MSDKISIISKTDIEPRINMVMSQTTYNSKKAFEKLKEFNYDHIKVIKDFMGIPEKKQEIKSVNQEIYKQLRHKLDASMREYNEKHPVNLDQIKDNIQESQSNLENKDKDE